MDHLISLLNHQVSFINQLIQIFCNLSDDLEYKNQIIKNLIVVNKRIALSKIDELITEFICQDNPNIGMNKAIKENKQKIIKEQKIDNKLNFYGKNSSKNECKLNEVSGGGRKEEEKTESSDFIYDKPSNENIIAKIKTKCNVSQNSNDKLEKIAIHISDSPINKSLNEISFDIERQMSGSLFKLNSVMYDGNSSNFNQSEASPHENNKDTQINYTSNNRNLNKLNKNEKNLHLFKNKSSKSFLSDYSRPSTQVTPKKRIRCNSTDRLKFNNSFDNANNPYMIETKKFYKKIKFTKSRYFNDCSPLHKEQEKNTYNKALKYNLKKIQRYSKNDISQFINKTNKSNF